ncbi:MAG TPA: protein kinase [Polyangiaceae bacterium]|nr:protein kinase [Polyangiaceae bacterium]
MRHSVLAQKYRLLEQLGQGGMGSVWRAEHLLLRSEVAVKLISPELATSREGLNRFLREAQAAASLRSPHVVQILDYGVDGDTPYIVMELLEGESLRTRLRRRGRIPPAELAELFTHLGRAIARAHEAGIIHRDLKPDNVFIVHNDEAELAKVLDFGVAKLSTQGAGRITTDATRSGERLGTPFYMSPEQVEDASRLDTRSDVWALGVIAFECLVGRRPFEAETMGALALAICSKPLPVPSDCADVPAGFDSWFARACSRELRERFSSAREATRVLKRICEGSAAGSARSSAAEIVPDEEPARDTPTEKDAPGRHLLKSFTTFSSSQARPLHASQLPRTLLVAAVLVLATAALLAWIRTRNGSAAPLPLVMSGNNASRASFPGVAASPRAAVARATPGGDEPKSISVESLPTAAAMDAHSDPPKPATASVRPATKPPATAVIVLEETSSDKDAPLPENPYRRDAGAPSWGF